MKKSLFILMGIALSAGACAPVAYSPGYGAGYASPGYVVAVGDRPYYTRGPYYIEHGRRYVWVRGHWGRRHGQRVWIPGRYMVR